MKIPQETEIKIFPTTVRKGEDGINFLICSDTKVIFFCIDFLAVNHTIGIGKLAGNFIIDIIHREKFFAGVFNFDGVIGDVVFHI